MPVYPVALLIQGTCQTTYYVGDYFDPTGLTIKIKYSDSSEIQTYSYIFGPQTPLTISDTTITFSYTESGVTVSNTVSISVIPRAYPISLEIITGSSYQYNQYYGDEFDTNGLSL